MPSYSPLVTIEFLSNFNARELLNNLVLCSDELLSFGTEPKGSENRLSEFDALYRFIIIVPYFPYENNECCTSPQKQQQFSESQISEISSSSWHSAFGAGPCHRRAQSGCWRPVAAGNSWFAANMQRVGRCRQKQDRSGWIRWLPHCRAEWRVFFFVFCFFFKDYFFIFFCFSAWGSFPCYLLHIGAKICVLHAFWS